MTIEAMKQWLEALELHAKQYPHMQKGYTVDAIASLHQAIANYTDLDAICQDLQEKTYTQAMRIAELEAKLTEAEKQEPVALQMDVIVVNLVREGINKHRARELSEHFIKHTHPQPKREWVGLTVMEAVELELATNHPREFAAAIEAKLKDKNGF